jgi:hypothetical protein
MSPTLTTHDTRFDNPDPATIAKVLAGLDGDRHPLATLGDSDLTHSQASGGVDSGSRWNSRMARLRSSTTGAAQAPGLGRRH